MSQTDAPPVPPPKPPKKPPKPKPATADAALSKVPLAASGINKQYDDAADGIPTTEINDSNGQSSTATSPADAATMTEEDGLQSKNPAASPSKNRLQSMTSDIVGSVGSMFSTMGMKTTAGKATEVTAAALVDAPHEAHSTTGPQREQEIVEESVISSSRSTPSYSKGRLKSMTSDIVGSIMSIRTNAALPSSLSPRRTSVTGTTGNDNDVAADPSGGVPGAIRHGFLSKMNREGKFEPNRFTLTPTHLSYRKDKRQQKSDKVANSGEQTGNDNEDNDNDDFRPVSTMSTMSSSTTATTTTSNSEVGSDDSGKNTYALETILIL